MAPIKRKSTNFNYPGSFKKTNYTPNYRSNYFKSTNPKYYKKRYFKKRGSGSFMRKTSEKVFDSYHVVQDGRLIITTTAPATAGNVSGALMAGGNVIFAPATTGAFDGYRSIYDSWRILKLTMVFWLGENDDITRPNEVAIEMNSCYDPDARGRGFATIEDFNKCNNSKHKIMRYGEKYKMVLYPKFPKVVTGSNAQPTGTTVTACEPGSQPWFDVSIAYNDRFTPAVGVSANATQYLFYGPKDTVIRYKIFSHMQWKGIRNGQQYKS